MKILAFLFLTELVFIFSGRAGSLDLSSLPDLQHAKYKVGPYITAAVRLQEMGHDSACQALLQFAQTNRANQQIAVLCRMLFAKRVTSEFRRPMIWGANFFGDSVYADWTLEPIEIVDGVPFAITRGYNGSGVPPQADEYLRYCMTNCDWSSFRFQEPTDKQKHDALAKLVASGKWKRPLNPLELEFLSAQIQ